MSPYKATYSFVVFCLLSLIVVNSATAQQKQINDFVFFKPPLPSLDEFFVSSSKSAESPSQIKERAVPADFKGKVVLINFWAEWCIPCRHELPYLLALQQSYPSEELQIILMDIDIRGPQAGQKFLQDNQLSALLNVYDGDKGDKGLWHALPIKAVPLSLLLDKQGRVFGYLAGSADWSSDDFRALIDGLIGE